MNSDLVSYYKNRAKEYEKIYDKPERQENLRQAGKFLQEAFVNKAVFEIACGTGYWTEKISGTAKSILATDINKEVIEIAKSKKYSRAKVEFEIADIFNLPNITAHESLFAGFIWSHIKLEDLHGFVNIVNSQVQKNGTIVFMDNNYVEGSNIPIADKDNAGNTFQIRTLEDGTQHKVLKNFPTEIFIRELLSNKATEIEFVNLKYYWILKYKNI